MIINVKKISLRFVIGELNKNRNKISSNRYIYKFINYEKKS